MSSRSSLDAPMADSVPEKTAGEQNDATHADLNAEPAVERPGDQAPPYSIFSSTQKKIFVFTVALGAVFSPMSTTIYLPALNTIASDLHVSNAKINLTVTSFLIFQGLAPAVIAGFSDSAGRRPAYMMCMVIYIAANIGLAVQRNYVALLVLRCLQSAGSSGTVALSQGVIADVVTSAERGTYMGYASVTTILGPILGPILGGVISQFAGWPWIFWFLTILSVAYFIPYLLFFPETCRKVVGDGSLPPPRLNWSWTNAIIVKRRAKAGIPVDEVQRASVAKKYKLIVPNPMSTLVIVADKEVSIVLFCSGLVVACLYALTTGVPSQFGEIYSFNDLKISLVFIPFGVGSIISAFTTGKMMDRNYRKYAKRAGMPLVKNRNQDLSNFPIERARLEVALPLLYLSCATTIAYGWVLYFRTSVAAPMVLIFFCGYGVLAAFQVLNILVIDLNPENAAAATAASNLFRCLLGVGSTAAVVPMINRINVGWTYTVLSLLWACFSPLLWVLMTKGPGLRRAKKERQERKRKDKNKGTQDVAVSLAQGAPTEEGAKEAAIVAEGALDMEANNPRGPQGER